MSQRLLVFQRVLGPALCGGLLSVSILTAFMGMGHAGLMAPTVPATPEALAGQSVRFLPNTPYIPGGLNLAGYETKKFQRSWVVLSPDRRRMAYTEVYFMPDNRQTTSRVYWAPVGNALTREAMLPPDEVARIQKDEAKHQEDNPSYVARVPVSKIQAQTVWGLYLPDQQLAQREELIAYGFDRTEPFRSDLAQIIDWKNDGRMLLYVYRPGQHHMGIYKTLPVLYRYDTREVTRLTLIPQRVWDAFTAKNPTLSNRVWDIRVLGWRTSETNQFVVKLVVFEGQSERAAGFWAYSLASGDLEYLGDVIDNGEVAQNGWLVSLLDPRNQKEPTPYGPGETPPDTPPAAPKSWGDRLRFWEK